MTVLTHQAIAESWIDIFGQERSGEIIDTPPGDEERLRWHTIRQIASLKFDTWAL